MNFSFNQISHFFFFFRPDPIINQDSREVDSKEVDSKEVIKNILSSGLSPEFKFDINSFVSDPDLKSFYLNYVQVSQNLHLKINNLVISL